MTRIHRFSRCSKSKRLNPAKNAGVGLDPLNFPLETARGHHAGGEEGISGVLCSEGSTRVGSGLSGEVCK